MARATWALGATSLAGAALALALYLDNRALRAELAARPAPGPAAPVPAAAAPPARVERAATPIGYAARTPEPALPDTAAESRLDRRAHRTEELAALLGRRPGESEADYRARVAPMISAGLLVPRLRLEEQRKIAQDRAHVTADQAQRLDQAFDKVYGDVLEFTNKAIADGQLSPYERNVASWLSYAGGLGAILDDANGQIARILEPSQVRAMYDSGFEWSEYLGARVPWEKLSAPPPRGR